MAHTDLRLMVVAGPYFVLCDELCIIGHVPLTYVPCMILDLVFVMFGLHMCAFIILLL